MNDRIKANSSNDLPATETDNGASAQFFGVSPLLIRPTASGQFAIYLRQDENLVLYARKDEAFTARHRTRLFDMGIKEVFVRMDQKLAYEGYLEENLAPLLADEDIPLPNRAAAFYEASVGVVKDLFGAKLPEPLKPDSLEKLQNLVRTVTKFFASDDALKHIARLIAHDYELYNHSINVMVLTHYMLQSFEKADHELMVKCALGALLHDFGKTRVPKAVLDRRLDTLSAKELSTYQTHPAVGVGMCTAVPLEQEVLHCILFHHEREDGSGYPSGLRGQDIPFYVKCLAVCDAYDNYTNNSAYGPARTPFEAIQLMRSKGGEFDKEVLKNLVLILANADIF